MVLPTEFDDVLENDVILEDTDQTQDYASLLKNSENMLKAFLYMKKLMDSTSPFLNAVINVATIDTSASRTAYSFSTKTGKILFKNINSTDNCSIFFNGGEFVLFPFETIELPVIATTAIETKGHLSIVESEYKIGKQ